MKDETTYKILGTAMEERYDLGCGFVETDTQKALEIEFMMKGHCH